MALISCSWCEHDIIGNETHGRVKVDQAPKQCAKCRDCRDRRVQGDAPGAQEFDITVTPIQIEAAEPGMSLATIHGGHAILFQVESKHFSLKQGEQATITLQSEPVEGGDPLTISGPIGQMVARVTPKW